MLSKNLFLDSTTFKINYSLKSKDWFNVNILDEKDITQNA